MRRDWPDQLAFGGQPLIEAEAVLTASLPDEGCALLLGTAPGPLWQVAALWPCLNCWLPAQERHRRFAIDPREQLLAQKWSRSRGWTNLGSLHSHPDAAPSPSDLDAFLAVRPALLLIAAPVAASSGAKGLPPNPAWRMRAWWLADGPAEDRFEPCAVPIVAP